jgi:hypothetical protein
MNFNIILPSTPGSSKWSSSLTFPYQSPLYTSPLPPMSFWLDHPNDIWWGVHSIKLLLMQSSSLPCYLIPLRPKYPSQNPILENPQPTFFPTI